MIKVNLKKWKSLPRIFGTCSNDPSFLALQVSKDSNQTTLYSSQNIVDGASFPVETCHHKKWLSEIAPKFEKNVQTNFTERDNGQGLKRYILKIKILDLNLFGCIRASLNSQTTLLLGLLFDPVRRLFGGQSSN